MAFLPQAGNSSDWELGFLRGVFANEALIVGASASILDLLAATTDPSQTAISLVGGIARVVLKTGFCLKQ